MTSDQADALSAAKKAILKQQIHGGAASRRGPSVPVTRRSRSGPTPLTEAQEPLWYYTQLAPGNPVYNETVTIRKGGLFDAATFRRAFNELVRRHEIWRSTFELIAGRPMQVVQAPPMYELPLIDLSELQEPERTHKAAKLAADEAKRPYQLDREPPIRPLLVRFAEHDHRLYLGLHHLIFDGVSLHRVVLPELIALYNAYVAGETSPLPEALLQYADYALWEREHQAAMSVNFARSIEFWRGHLAGASTLRLPLDHPRGGGQRFHGAMEPIHVSAELTERLRAVGHTAGATIFQTLAAAFACLLYRYSGQDDIVFGTVTDLRRRPELHSMVGYCLTPLVLRLDLHSELNFLRLLSAVREELLSGLANQVPFDRLVRELGVLRDPGVNPIFQTSFVLEPRQAVPDGDWSLEEMDVAIGNLIGHSKFDLQVELDERAEGSLSGRLIYNTDVFDAQTAARMTTHWQTLLESVVRDPDKSIAELQLLSKEELHLQLVELNATKDVGPPKASVDQLVTAQAARSPRSVAVVVGDHRSTYADLETRANEIANRLRAAGAAPGTVVGIAVERSLDLVTGLLAILKSGAAYVPLDPHHPQERLSFILEDSGASVLLTQLHLLEGLPRHQIATVCIDDPPAGDQRNALAPPHITSPEDLAYVLYTSGSTGRPKGVRVRHRNVVNLMSALAERPGLSADDVVLAVATHIFDMSVGDIFPTLGTGARLVLASRDDARDPRRLSQLIETSRATIMHATPVTWQMLVDSGWKGSPRLVAVSGGDTLSDALAGALLDRCAAVWNGYGPTETTVYATFARVSRGVPISIGRPIANVRAYILDRQLRLVPLGVPGELAIGGGGVAAGYMNRPDETTLRFVPDPFVNGEPMYRTGDLARLLPEGSIVHMGRLDRQVKVRGVRIEPGEIESALVAHPAISAAVVSAREDAAGDRRLVAHVVAAGHAPSDGELRSWLESSLPRHMVPAAFVHLERLPVTASGKVDRAALPLPDPGARNGRIDLVAPRNDVEERLARIWARLLGVAQVGVEDDFFDLGGHSLLAVRLLAAIEDELGVDMPVADFIEGRTSVARQAAFINAARRHHPLLEQSAPDLLVRAQPGGSRPSLFFILPTPQAMFIRHYVGPLGSDQPVLGVLGPEQDGHSHRYSGTLAELVTPRVQAIRAEQPEGPYYLAGYSLGGVLAYEIAGQLRAAGEEVAWLGLLNTSTPSALARFWRWRYLRIGRVALHLSPRTVRRTLRDQFRVWRLGAGLPANLVDGFDPHAAIQLSLGHRCSGHDAPLNIFATADQKAIAASRSLGWDKVHHGMLTVHNVPGDHRTMVSQSKEVRMIAELFARSLRAAQGAG